MARPCRSGLVAAYIPGMDIYPSDFKQLQPCRDRPRTSIAIALG